MPALVVAALVVHRAGTLHPSAGWGQSRNFSDYGSDPISEPVSADACANLGPENASNLKLVECLQQNRRAEIRLVAK